MKPAPPEQPGTPDTEQGFDVQYALQQAEEARRIRWEETQEQLRTQVMSNLYSALRSAQVTLVLGVANKEFPQNFKQEIRALLIQMAAGLGDEESDT